MRAIEVGRAVQCIAPVARTLRELVLAAVDADLDSRQRDVIRGSPGNRGCAADSRACGRRCDRDSRRRRIRRRRRRRHSAIAEGDGDGRNGRIACRVRRARRDRVSPVRITSCVQSARPARRARRRQVGPAVDGNRDVGDAGVVSCAAGNSCRSGDRRSTSGCEDRDRGRSLVCLRASLSPAGGGGGASGDAKRESGDEDRHVRAVTCGTAKSGEHGGETPWSCLGETPDSRGGGCTWLLSGGVRQLRLARASDPTHRYSVVVPPEELELRTPKELRAWRPDVEKAPQKMRRTALAAADRAADAPVALA